MNTQYLEFVRQQLIVATADLSGATKGQLVAFAENVRNPLRRRAAVGGRKYSMLTSSAWLTRTGSADKRQPVARQRLINRPGQPGRVRDRHRGAALVLSLEGHQKAWLLWNYSENIRFEYQVAITQWAWGRVP